MRRHGRPGNCVCDGTSQHGALALASPRRGEAPYLACRRQLPRRSDGGNHARIRQDLSLPAGIRADERVCARALGCHRMGRDDGRRRGLSTAANGPARAAAEWPQRDGDRPPAGTGRHRLVRRTRDAKRLGRRWRSVDCSRLRVLLRTSRRHGVPSAPTSGGCCHSRLCRPARHQRGHLADGRHRYGSRSTDRSHVGTLATARDSVRSRRPHWIFVAAHSRNGDPPAADVRVVRPFCRDRFQRTGSRSPDDGKPVDSPRGFLRMDSGRAAVGRRLLLRCGDGRGCGGVGTVWRSRACSVQRCPRDDGQGNTDRPASGHRAGAAGLRAVLYRLARSHAHLGHNARDDQPGPPHGGMGFGRATAVICVGARLRAGIRLHGAVHHGRRLPRASPIRRRDAAARAARAVVFPAATGGRGSHRHRVFPGRALQSSAVDRRQHVAAGGLDHVLRGDFRHARIRRGCT